MNTRTNLVSKLAIILLALAATSARAQVVCNTTIAGGTVADAQWTLAGSPYCITGDLGVSLLTIDRGVEVYVDGPYAISVLAALNAVGSESNPILFSSFDPESTWQGIKFNSTPPGSVLKHCIVELSADSGITIIDSDPSISHCTIRDNNGAQTGAGIYIELDKEPPLTVTLRDNIITGNKATQGGNNCMGAGVGSGGGGGVYANIDSGSLVIEGSRITDNVSGRANVRGSRLGGGVWLDIADPGSATVRTSVISGNDLFAYNCACLPAGTTSVARGAGIYATGNVTIENTVLRDNSADAKECFTGSGFAGGSGIFAESGHLELTNSVIADGLTSPQAGGNTPALRAALYVNTGTANATNVTIVENDAVGVATDTGSATLRNCIAYFSNSGNEQLAGNVVADYCNIQGAYVGTGNIDFGPVVGVTEDLAILPGSPAINAGDPDAAYNDSCFPPSLGTTRNDMGAHGGDGACLWNMGPPVQRIVPLPDINSDGIEDVALLREGSILAEIRSGANGSLQKNITFLDGRFTPISAVALPDSDGNGVAELGVLASRNSDGRIVVEIRNITGAEVPRSVWFAPNHTAVGLTVVDDDADNNGIVELAVLSRRDSDGRGLVEVKNAFGATNPKALWAGAGLTSTDVEVLGDKDANGIPEIAILSTRDSDGRIVAEIKNAAGVTLPTAVWFAPGHTAIDMVAVDDKDSNGVPEVAVLSRRDSDGRNVVEIKNASGPAALSAVWFAEGHTATDVKQVHDADGNSIPEVAVLSTRDSDGRILVEIKNAFGATNSVPVWYSPGFEAKGLAILGDTDANGIEEALVLMIRDSDERILAQGRNAIGGPGLVPKNYWFSP